MMYKSNTIKDVGSGQAPSYPSQDGGKGLGPGRSWQQALRTTKTQQR